jgi:hypothetical protein
VASLAGSDVRLAELIASISLATDLGLGQPMEHVLRSCILGLRIAADLELDESERAAHGVRGRRSDDLHLLRQRRRSTAPG